MVSAGDFRKGVTIEIDGQVWVIVDFQHVKPGKGAAFVRTKIKNVVTGNVLERTFNPTEKYPKAMVREKRCSICIRMAISTTSWSRDIRQLPLGKALVEEAMQYVKENSNVTVKFFKGEAFSVEAPNFVELEIVETEPGFKGDTATSGNKPAVLETGAKVMVPLFVQPGRSDPRGYQNGRLYGARLSAKQKERRTAALFMHEMEKLSLCE